MKYFLVCFLLIISCKSAIRDEGSPNVMVGTAYNDKPGAILGTDKVPCMINGLRSWDSIYLGKKVKVKGEFRFVNWERDRVKSENPFVNTLQAQIYPEFFVVKNATWELYNSD
ncbi:MAG: hypothetical protein BM557_07345 [Flavobacterium sp. MedPE-SWcel]|uniref:hypothetical protein n=1 Tax=uncultured Flavobacterium sp. TaxID=165435 RepID=UPI00091F54BD|nr:hypothetical protein [uncultured Flavobacterium sp.]OIQ18026.1 MAG: hypothetical protein BM557_07345 [Flavobacterium sp. MedPE-SWcel]